MHKLEYINMHRYVQQTCLPQNTFVSTPKSIRPYFQIFDRIFLWMHHQTVKTKECQRSIFYHSSCKNSVSTHIFNYTDTLHSDEFILFTSAKVVLDQRPQNTFSKNNAPCVLLLLMPMRPFLKGCLIRVCFLGFVHSSSSSPVSCNHLSPTASDSNPPYIRRWLTSIKF